MNIEESRKAADLMMILSGALTQTSINKGEEKISMNFPIPLRPTVVKFLTESLEHLVGKGEEKLVEGVGAFLSDIIDEGMLSMIKAAKKEMN